MERNPIGYRVWPPTQVQVSASGTSTTSTTFVDIPGLTVTEALAEGVRERLYRLHFEAALTATGGTPDVFFQFAHDGTAITFEGKTDGKETLGNIPVTWISFVNWVILETDATHTLSAQWRVGSNGAEVDGVRAFFAIEELGM